MRLYSDMVVYSADYSRNMLLFLLQRLSWSLIVCFNLLRTGFVQQPVRWSPVARVKYRRTMGSKPRWGMVPQLGRKGAASPKSALLWWPPSKQKLKHPPLLKTQPLLRALLRAQHSPQTWSPTQRTVLIQPKTDSPHPPPLDEANPRGCCCQSSSAFVDPGATENAYCKCCARKLKDLSNSTQGLGTEKKVESTIRK